MRASKKVVAASAARAASKRERTPLQSEQRLQCVIELAADFYWEQDEHHRFTVYRPSREPDPAFAKLLGQTSFEFFARSVGGWETHHVALAARQPFRGVVQQLGGNDDARYFSMSGQPLFDKRGKFTGYRGIARDVSAEIRATRLGELEHLVSRTLAEADDIGDGLVGSSRVDLQACKLEYSIVSPK